MNFRKTIILRGKSDEFLEKGGGGCSNPKSRLPKTRNIVFRNECGGVQRPFESFPKIHPKWSMFSPLKLLTNYWPLKIMRLDRKVNSCFCAHPFSRASKALIVIIKSSTSPGGRNSQNFPFFPRNEWRRLQIKWSLSDKIDQISHSPPPFPL